MDGVTDEWEGVLMLRLTFNCIIRKTRKESSSPLVTVKDGSFARHHSRSWDLISKQLLDKLQIIMTIAFFLIFKQLLINLRWTLN